jgi:iron complex outermembrane receptor protein
MKNSFFVFFYFVTAHVFAQTITIKGVVKDAETAQTLPGATVMLAKTFTATSTNSQGEFSLSIPSSTKNASLEISYLGYQTYKTNVVEFSNNPIEIKLKKSTIQTEEVVIAAYRASEKSGLAVSNLDAVAIKQLNTGVDIPIMLNQIPSAVTNSDAGAGVGYTGIRIRGSDGTRINVTMNGIPVNDAESHGVFWVNMPDLASSVNSIQVQRGVGTSTNGAAAFGASINLNTNQAFSKTFAEVTNGFGSFNTRRHSVKLGLAFREDSTANSALWNIEGRLSKISSDGFIDRAFSDLKSFYASAARIGKKSVFRLNVFSGREQTYQAWYGIPQDIYQTNRTYNEAGLYFDKNGNQQFYENETDNYQQDHYQAHYTYEFNNRWTFNTALHYTYGRGYFEQYRFQDRLSTYGSAPIVLFDQAANALDTITRSDLIRQRHLDNHFYGQVFSLIYQAKRLSWITGGGWNIYEGKHFGNVIWAEWAQNIPLNSRYYDNDARKTDLNLYSRATYDWNSIWSTTIDLQVRSIDYSFLGFNQFQENVQQTANFLFFNPKLAINANLNQNSSAYASASVGNREPVRDDFTQSTPQSRPKAERMIDFEAGYKWSKNKLKTGINAYLMAYENQLVLTGAVNDVGAYIRSNVDRSYRAGVELEAAYQLSPSFDLSGNLALSQNKIIAFTEFLDDYDTFEQVAIERKNTDISFSPNVVGALSLTYHWKEAFSLSLISKYVGRQFLDNTSSIERSLDPFFVSDLRLITNPFQQAKNQWLRNVGINLMVANLFNAKYAPNGYTFSGLIGGVRNDFNYLYPMAGTNFMLNLTLKW